MYPQFKFGKQVKKCPVKPKSLLPIHDARVRVCAKRLKMVETGTEKKNCDRKRSSGLLWIY